MSKIELYKLISKIYEAFELLTDSTYLDLLSNPRYDWIYETWQELEKLKNELEEQISEND